MEQVFGMINKRQGPTAALLRIGIPVLIVGLLLGFAALQLGWPSPSAGGPFPVVAPAFSVTPMQAQTSLPSPTVTAGNPVLQSVPTYNYLPLIITDQAEPEPTAQTIFADEFDGSTLDADKWNTVYPWGGTHEDNHELECYTPSAVTVSNGYLHLRASKETVQCYVYGGVITKTYAYQSGMVASHGKYSLQYGYIEMRAQLPKGQGLWPAFWLLKEVTPPRVEDWPPEIDVFEVLGSEPTKVYMTNWYGTERSPISQQSNYVGPDTSLAFHTYAIDWQPGRITWYIDGIKRAEVTDHVPATAMYLIANLAVGGDWPGPPDSSTPLPSEVTVDYIRVYSQKP